MSLRLARAVANASVPNALDSWQHALASIPRKEEIVALHRLTSIAIGVPNVAETAAYYEDVGRGISYYYG